LEALKAVCNTFLSFFLVRERIALQDLQWPQAGLMAFTSFAWRLEELLSGASLDNAVQGRLADHLTHE
jgi:hypothetical protein